MNFILRHYNIFSLLALPILLFNFWFVSHQYPNDAQTAATASGSMAFFVGILFYMILREGDLYHKCKKDGIIKLHKGSLKQVIEMREYLEQPNNAMMVAHSINTHRNLVKFIQESNPKVLVEMHNVQLDFTDEILTLRPDDKY